MADLVIEPHPVTHPSHPTCAYLLRLPTAATAWAPEFWEFPAWAAGVDLMFANAAGWNRPIGFAGRVSGHMAALDVARRAREHRVKRLVFAHIGRPSLRDRCRIPAAVRGMGPARPYLPGSGSAYVKGRRAARRQFGPVASQWFWPAT